MQNHYQIVFAGKILPGFTPEQVRQTVAAKLNLSPTSQEALFSGRRAILKHNLDFETADRVRDEYAKFGMKVHLEPERSVAVAARAALKDADDDLAILPPISEAEAAKPSPTPVKKQPNTISAGAAITPNTLPTAEIALSLTPAAPEEVVCPKCNERQPKRTLCRACGLDMPRFIAAQEQAEKDARAARREAAEQSRAGRSAPKIRRPEAKEELELDDSGVPALLGIGFSGRFNRSRYLASHILSFAVLALAMLGTTQHNFIALALGVLAWLFLYLRATVLRIHDLGKSGWMVLLFLIPLVGNVFSLCLIFWSGDTGDNEYGEQPAGTGLKLILGIVLVFGILAAMVGNKIEHQSALKHSTDPDSSRVEPEPQ